MRRRIHACPIVAREYSQWCMEEDTCMSDEEEE
jgi:hypothetical protein